MSAMTEEMPPTELEDPEPELDDPPGTETGLGVAFPNEAERAALRPEEKTYQYGSGASYSGYNEDYQDPYQQLGGLTRPDAYYGAIEFDCPTCKAVARTADFDGEKCRIWIERTNKYVIRKMPCLSRIKLARERGIL